MSDQSYILNIRNPQVIPVVYELLQDGPKTEDEISDMTGLEGSLLDEALDGLLSYRLATKTDFKYNAESLTFDTNRGLDLQLTMLSNVKDASAGDNWDLQAGLFLTYTYFLKEDLQYFRYSDGALQRKIDSYHQELGFRPEEDNPDDGPAKLQKEKLNNWAKHASLLGLAHNARGSEYTITPAREVLFVTVQLAHHDIAAEDDILYIKDYIDWLNENLLRVPFTDNTLPKPLGRVLYSLARDDELALVRVGDPPTVSMDYVPRSHQNVNRRINAIQVTADGS